MRAWYVLFLAAAACRATPLVAPLQFTGARGSLRVWASDSGSHAPITALSGELRIGTRVTFAPVRSAADTLMFLYVPVGAYDLTIRRIGYDLRTLPVQVSSVGNDSLHIVLQSRLWINSGDIWPQSPWWKFWRR